MSENVDIVLPEQQEGTESIIGRWLKASGDFVNLHEPVLEISTDKVVVELASPAAGILEVLKNEGQQVQPGDLLGRINQSGERKKEVKAAPPSATPKAPVTSGETKDLSPAVRKLINEHKLDPSLISGSGRGGRITHEDVMTYLNKRSDGPGSKRVPHTAMRRSIATHMVESVKQAPHVTTVFDADMSAVLSHREKHKGEFEANGVKLTLTSYFIRAACQALKFVPEVNSRWHEDSVEIFDACHLGVAIALESTGLLAPIIRSADKLNLFETAKALQDLTSRARENKLSPADVQGGTFTISNHGVSGSLFAAPIIIHQPQAAILGVGRLEKRAVVRGDREDMEIKPMVYITLTIDHRVLDGYQANTYLAKLVEELEGWSS